MRRALLVLAVVTAGAGRPASGQAHVDVHATLDSVPIGNSRTFSLYMTDLVNDPTWRGMLGDAYPISLHWKIQVWQPHSGLLGLTSKAGPSTQWDQTIEPRPLMGQYLLRTKFANRQPSERVFTSLDSLDKELGTWLGGPAALVPRAPGDWYYFVTLTITTLTPDQLANLQKYMNSNSPQSALDRLLQGTVLGRGLPSIVLTANTATFTIPKR